MSQRPLAVCFVLAMGMSAAIAAQTPQPQTPPTDPAQPRTTDQKPQTMDQQKHAVTVEGCLVQERDVPGRQPNVAERAGVTPDYILTMTKFVKGEPAGSTPPAAAEPATPTGTSGVQPMFEVRGIDQAKLKQHVGQRVQIEGTIDPTDLKEREEAKRKGQTGNDFPEVNATAIRQVSGECRPAR